MTEEEAKTKWCPMLRKGPPGTSRNAPEDVPNLCIGSACMMWRKVDLSKVPMNEIHNYGEDVGYCGLAGKP